MNYNHCALAGHLGKEPELRYTSNGNPVVQFSIAINRRWKGKDGEKKEETSWIDAEVWGSSAENFSKYCRKGTNVFIDGELKQDTWEDRNTGQKRSKVILSVRSWQICSPKGESPQRQNRPEEPTRGQEAAKGQEAVVEDDEIPF